MTSLKKVAANPQNPAHVRQLTEEVLGRWANGKVDPIPVLIYAGYEDVPNKNAAFMYLVMSDEDFDLKGFVVREVHHHADANDLVIEEHYPEFESWSLGGRGGPAAVRFQPRSTVSQRRDEAAWEAYASDKSTELPFPKRPDVFISYPQPGKIDVFIYVYDSQGHESKAVPLEHGALHTLRVKRNSVRTSAN